MKMQKLVVRVFLATCLRTGLPESVAAAVVQETEHGIGKSCRALAAVGEVSGKAIGMAGERTGKAGETVAKVSARTATNAGRAISKGSEEVGRESGKAGEEVAKGVERVGKGTVRTVEKISGKNQQPA